MKTNKWILGGLMAMAITACTSDELVENTNPTQGKKVTVTAYASGDAANSRVSFADDNTSKVTLSWKDTESFSVVYHTTAQTFSKTTAGNTFTGILPYDNENNESNYYAVYPALPANTSLTAANTVPFDLSTQTGALDESKTYMRASSSYGLSYSFQHCTAILKATFANIPSGAKISQVVVKTSHPDSKVDGNLNLTDGTISGGSNNTITINYTTPVGASTPVYIYLPPMAADKKALTFTVTTEDEKQYTGTLAGSNDNGIVAGMVYKAEVAVTERAVTGYLTFTAAGGQTLEMSTAVSGLQYSTDGENWTNLGTDLVNFNGNNQLFLRGKNSSGTNTARISFGDDNVKVACSGDIRTLVNYENFKEITDVGNATFRSLFANCTELTSAPELPFTKLAQSCYNSMFSGCTSLTEAPALPATTLAQYCYNSMFSGCTSLTEAPALPATTLQNNCYREMFSGCTALTTAPELNATILTQFCYYKMFSGCTSLTTAPALPATTLSWYCYAYMFSGCTLLTTAPALNATTLQIQCYDHMFENCTSLTTAPTLNATTLAANCCQSMFSGCIALTTAPALPATTLAQSCYNSMFSGCTSLTTAPALPATTLAGACYNNMFFGCENLKKVIMLATDISAPNCLYEWLKGVSSSGTFTKAASMTSLPTGVHGIPSDWVVEDYVAQGN